MTRQPLFKAVAPPLTERERLDMVQQARRAIAEQEQLRPGLKARGVAALQSAEARLLRDQPLSARRLPEATVIPPTPARRRRGG